MEDSAPIPVDPARLAAGGWCHRTERYLGKGEIYASYSADRIGMGQPVRKPFSWHGGLWVCVGIAGRRDELTLEAYRLVHPSAFTGTPVTYAQKVADSEAARNDPDGFRHGMIVKHSGQNFVLCGPPVSFVPGQAAQLTLF